MFVWFLIFLALAGCSTRKDQRAVANEAATDRIALSGGTLIDGTGKEPLKDATVVITGRRIEAIHGSEYKLEAHTRLIRIDGKFLLPGLFDAHVHYQGWAAPLYLANGITSVIDTGNVTAWILAQRFAVANDLVAGPRIFTVGAQLNTPPNQHDHAILVSTEQEAREAVRQHIRRHVDGIKIYTNIRPNVLKAVIEEAHAAGLPVRGHIAIDAKEAALLGIDGLEHATGIAIATMEDQEKLREVEKKRYTDAEYLVNHASLDDLAYYMTPELYDALINVLVRQKTFITPTLATYWMGVHSHSKEYEEENRAVLNDPKQLFIPEWSRWGIVARYPHFASVMSDPKFKIGYAKLQEFIKAFVTAGGKVVAGSDDSLLAMHGKDLHRELELLVEAGLTPLQALQAATRNAAELMRKASDIGTIEPGKLADLIVVNGDPLRDIRNTRNVELVIKDGKVLDISYDSRFLDAIPRPLSEDQRQRYQARQFKK